MLAMKNMNFGRLPMKYIIWRRHVEFHAGLKRVSLFCYVTGTFRRHSSRIMTTKSLEFLHSGRYLRVYVYTSTGARISSAGGQKTSTSTMVYYNDGVKVSFFGPYTRDPIDQCLGRKGQLRPRSENGGGSGNGDYDSEHNNDKKNSIQRKLAKKRRKRAKLIFHANLERVCTYHPSPNVIFYYVW